VVPWNKLLVATEIHAMKWINIQLQSERSFEVDKQNVIDAITSGGLLADISEGNDDGTYINISFKVSFEKQRHFNLPVRSLLSAIEHRVH
jgi:hypothetical protein